MLLLIRDEEPTGDGRISLDEGAGDGLNGQGFVRRCNRLAHFLSVFRGICGIVFWQPCWAVPVIALPVPVVRRAYDGHCR